jgi:hypothetical protein
MPIYRQPSGPQYAPTLTGEEFRQQTGGLARSLGGFAETLGGIKEKRRGAKDRERKQALKIAEDLYRMNEDSDGKLFEDSEIKRAFIKAWSKGTGSEGGLPSDVSLGPLQTPFERTVEVPEQFKDRYRIGLTPQGGKEVTPISQGEWEDWGYGQMRNKKTGEIKKVPTKPETPKLMKGPGGKMVEKIKGAEYYKKPEISPTEKRMRAKELRDVETKVLLNPDNEAVRPQADFFNENSNKNYFLVPITTEEWGADTVKFEKFPVPKEAKKLGWTAALIRKKAKEENLSVIDAMRKWGLLE